MRGMDASNRPFPGGMGEQMGVHTGESCLLPVSRDGYGNVHGCGYNHSPIYIKS